MPINSASRIIDRRAAANKGAAACSARVSSADEGGRNPLKRARDLGLRAGFPDSQAERFKHRGIELRGFFGVEPMQARGWSPAPVPALCTSRCDRGATTRAPGPGRDPDHHS
jgi:hypothetical protein